MKPLLIAFPGHEDFSRALARLLDADTAELALHRFPDGESLPRLPLPLEGRRVAFVCPLDRPDGKILSLLFAARTARELGAARVGLVAPYLAYMRQDRRFHDGESVTSIHFAELISGHFDWLATVDPHLHRHRSLDAIYAVPAMACHAAPAIAQWIAAHMPDAVLVGPDGESRQWVADIAGRIGAPWTTLMKTRSGDDVVGETLADAHLLQGRRPVIVDDILSTGRTVLEAARLLRAHGADAVTCVAVHAVFAGDAGEQLARHEVRVVTTNTIPHASNAIDIASDLAIGVGQLLS
ncbi:MAG: ribose-phosphate diphosphokinase [Proteobacteria bacterium]|nr:ribose-phosphate diphosphokinase [Pseudomonadota bacterium]